MYNHLVNATKNRIIQELRDLFYRHPTYKNLEIYNRFPINERIQEGIIVRNQIACARQAADLCPVQIITLSLDESEKI